MISHSIFDSSNREKLAMITKHMEAYLEELICFCGGCGTYGVECFDLYQAICDADQEFLQRFHKIYYKVSAKTSELKRKQKENA